MSSRAIQMTVKSPDFATNLLWALNAKRLIGQRVAARMEELGFDTDEALAREAHVTVKTIWRLRNGKTYPRAETARRVSAALNLPFSDLRPPTSQEDDPEVKEMLNETLRHLKRIELAMGVEDEKPADLDSDLSDAGEAAADVETADAEPGHTKQRPSGTNA